MSKTRELFETIETLYDQFKENHETFTVKGTKSSAQRARKAIGDIKKLVTDYRKASVEETK
jgi:soluble cytochrome b562